MKETLRKIRERKGFTLAEMLIVVAIIGVLVAVSVPVFTSKLNDAKLATDKANQRAAKAAAVTEYLSNKETGSVDYYYNADAGVVTKDNTVVIEAYGASSDVEGGYVKVTVSSSGSSMEWVERVNGSVTTLHAALE